MINIYIYIYIYILFLIKRIQKEIETLTYFSKLYILKYILKYSF